MNRHTISVHMMLTARPSAIKVCEKVPTIMIASSTPSKCEAGFGQRHIIPLKNSLRLESHTHAFPTQTICQPPKEDLSKDTSQRRCDLQAKVLLRRKCLKTCIAVGVWAVHKTEHDRCDVNLK